jgi:hypothetical protein
MERTPADDLPFHLLSLLSLLLFKLALELLRLPFAPAAHYSTHSIPIPPERRLGFPSPPS